MIMNKNKQILKHCPNYYKIMDFLRVSDYYSVTHRTIVKLINDMVYINYYCLDASEFILNTIKESIYEE